MIADILTRFISIDSQNHGLNAHLTSTCYSL
ncbi:hypothetical protein PLUTE_a6014 [Pseudoalteromonas luteoviolacea DSM 6061]|nr:hypothetical protein [Pseudoalteromonas luteoviolacea DSM 6061]